jgi:heme/copper-type cytochrome/quinol oxidase subunit 1
MESHAGTPSLELGAETITESRVKRWVLAYVGASTVFLFVAGLLGMLLRESQADLVRLDPGVFYAIMTAHGVGAFVAWTAFAVMGLFSGCSPRWASRCARSASCSLACSGGRW